MGMGNFSTNAPIPYIFHTDFSRVVSIQDLTIVEQPFAVYWSDYVTDLVPLIALH